MHLHELLGWAGPMTHRQYLAWQEWLRSDLNRPSRSDHYLMQVAQHVVLPYIKEGATPPDLKSLVIQFGDGDRRPVEPGTEDEETTDGPPTMTEESIARAHREIAIARMGGGVGVERRWVNKRGEPIPPPPGAQR